MNTRERNKAKYQKASKELIGVRINITGRDPNIALSLTVEFSMGGRHICYNQAEFAFEFKETINLLYYFKEMHNR